MSAYGTASSTPGSSTSTRAPQRGPADVAYRRAWRSLWLYPVSFVLAFVIGEGLLSLLAEDESAPAFWEALVSLTPALVVFVVPGALAAWFGRRAMRLGREDGRVPALVGAAIGLGFAALNLLTFLGGALTG